MAENPMKSVVVTTTNDATTRHLRKVNILSSPVAGTSLPSWLTVTADGHNTHETVVSVTPTVTGLKTVIGATGGAGGGGATDPDFANVVLLWECEGTNGDIGPWTAGTGQTITRGSGLLDNTRARFGTTSLKVGASGSNTLPDSDNWDLSNANADTFTVEFSAYHTDSQDWYILADGLNAPQKSWRVRTVAGIILMNFSLDGSGDEVAAQSAGGIFTTGAWHDICLEKNSAGKIRIYLNGAMVASNTPANSNFWNSTSTMTINSHATNQGWVDHIRITKGVARYDSDAGYTVSTAAFPTS